MKLKVAVITAAVALMASSAFAAQGSSWIGLTVHGDMPMGDFGDNFGFGYGGTASYTYMVTEPLGIGADVGYHTWGASDDFLAGAPSDFDATFNAIQFGAHGKYVIPGNEKMMPYIKVGLGMYNGSVSFDNPPTGLEEPDSESDFGISVGGGLDFLASENYTIGGQVMFHNVMTEGESTQFITLGIGVNFGMGGK
jgi:opacity protein-like surface antigen